MKHTRILFLIALVAGLGLMPGWELTSGAQTCQQEGACFAFESQGYITDPTTGQTTIAFRVTNKCKSLASYVAIGTGGFTRVAPADKSSYNGDLSPYDVSWTRTGGTPGFESVIGRTLEPTQSAAPIPTRKTSARTSLTPAAPPLAWPWIVATSIGRITWITP